MLNTNDISQIAQSIGTAIGGLFTEIVTTLLTVGIPILIAYWKKSKTQKRIIDALVRGIEKSDDRIQSEDTAFVKKSVQMESEKAGVEHHVDKAVREVTNKMAEEKIDAQTLKGDGI